MMELFVCCATVINLKVFQQKQSSGLTVTNADAGLILSVHLEAMQSPVGFCARSVPFNHQVLYIHITRFFHLFDV